MIGTTDCPVRRKAARSREQAMADWIDATIHEHDASRDNLGNHLVQMGHEVGAMVAIGILKADELATLVLETTRMMREDFRDGVAPEPSMSLFICDLARLIDKHDHPEECPLE